MRGFNRVVLMGNLTRDPELRQIPSGVSVADIGLATSETYKNRDGELVETTCFVDIEAWGKQAETCSQYLTKGSPVLVEGRLRFNRWETPEGQVRTKLRVRADRVQFLSRPKSSAEFQGPASEEPTEEAGDDNMPF